MPFVEWAKVLLARIGEVVSQLYRHVVSSFPLPGRTQPSRAFKKLLCDSKSKNKITSLLRVVLVVVLVSANTVLSKTELEKSCYPRLKTKSNENLDLEDRMQCKEEPRIINSEECECEFHSRLRLQHCY